jgi:hypothetical protein
MGRHARVGDEHSAHGFLGDQPIAPSHEPAFNPEPGDRRSRSTKLNLLPGLLITSPAPSTYLWPGCGVTRADGGDPAAPWIITVDEDFCVEPDRARELAAQLLAAADLAEALRAADN